MLDAVDRLLSAGATEDSLSMRAVAKEVGVSPPALYLHFADKRELLYAVCERHFHGLEATMREETAGVDGPLEVIQGCGRAYVRFGLAHPEAYRMMFVSGAEAMQVSPEQVADLVAFTFVLAAVEHALEAGAIAAADPVEVALLLWTSVHGIVSLRLSKPDFPWPPLDDQLDHMLTTVGLGLTVPRPGTRS